MIREKPFEKRSAMQGKILVVDDEKDMLALFKRIITEKTQHQVEVEYDPEKAIEQVRQTPFHVVFTDLKMPKMDGIVFLEAVRELQPQAAVVMMTAYATIETAVEATRKGALDYITKPFRKERILLTIERALDWQALRRENMALRESLAHQKPFPTMIGSSKTMISLLDRIKKVARSTATILIEGESGTGKELAAQAIHAHSNRPQGPFVTIDCTAIPEQIIESELFGHRKGAFTGAWKDKRGLVDEAHGGTLFLDEIGELSTLMQGKLLRLLQDGAYKPVGAVNTKYADVRFVAATNRDLKELVGRKQFRADLFYRLNVIRFRLPPLRERREDIPLLARHLIGKYSVINHKTIDDIEPKTMAMLMTRTWPGNVRELENVIERGVILSRSGQIHIDDLSTDGCDEVSSPDFLEEKTFRLPFREAKNAVIKKFHRQYIQALLQQHHGNISKAAEQAGVQRQYLHRIIKEEGIEAEAFKSI
jgi:DNA-binding NtrC family response regulator